MLWGFSPDFLLAVIGILIGLCCAVGIGLQFFAWRHLKPGIPRWGHKDALFRKKEEYYTEEGMRYVNMQKNLMIAMTPLLILLIVVIEYAAEGPPPGH